jgi:hypothetical protein
LVASFWLFSDILVEGKLIVPHSECEDEVAEDDEEDQGEERLFFEECFDGEGDVSLAVYFIGLLLGEVTEPLGVVSEDTTE